MNKNKKIKSLCFQRVKKEKLISTKHAHSRTSYDFIGIFNEFIDCIFQWVPIRSNSFLLKSSTLKINFFTIFKNIQLWKITFTNWWFSYLQKLNLKSTGGNIYIKNWNHDRFSKVWKKFKRMKSTLKLCFLNLNKIEWFSYKKWKVPNIGYITHFLSSFLKNPAKLYK